MTTDECPACASLREAVQNALAAGDSRKAVTMQRLYDQHRAQHRQERESSNLINQLWPNARVR